MPGRLRRDRRCSGGRGDAVGGFRGHRRDAAGRPRCPRSYPPDRLAPTVPRPTAARARRRPRLRGGLRSSSDAQGRKLKMTDELFGDRRKALEEAFFAKQNERVKQQLRAKQEGQARREALAAASGIRDEGVLDKLVSLGLGAETLAVLSLVPLVEVAWADGTIDAKERAAI